jgi:hypothetical protein
MSNVARLNHLTAVELPIWRNQRRIDEARKDDRYFDAVLAHFLIERLGKSDQAELGCGISCPVRLAGFS